ncbi:MAG: hypothetical protein QME60_04755 [Verrucomicrobiota bacterium]|nr:hypothetical protein [Verrucomicrobiota bacterium]
MARGNAGLDLFVKEAGHILALEPDCRVNRLGGYGPAGEVIYNAHPSGCPSVLVDSRKDATATFMSNGSVSFVVKLPDGMEIRVLDGHFDPIEKREMGAPSNNVWLALGAGNRRRIVSLMNPNNHANCPARRIRLVKLGDPARAMWYAAWFDPQPGVSLASAIRLSLRYTSKGPALLREIVVKNLGKKPARAELWTYYNLHGTQKFVYNKELWYDAGYPVTPADIVMTARVPYSEIIQIKRLSTTAENAWAVEATCDYSAFVGDTAQYALIPRAVGEGRLLKTGAGRKINRFATAAVGATRFQLRIPAGGHAALRQALLFVTDAEACERFKKLASYTEPSYKAMTKSFERATRSLLAGADVTDELVLAAKAEASAWPRFEVRLPTERAVAEYANSVWTGVKDLYENCRAHGARLADGIELGTRDCGQDMWPKIKEDPGRVRADLIHAMSFMCVTHEGPFPKDRPLTLREKLHGMFPRQFPSHWNNRAAEVKNDNRPYADSPLWLINSLAMYIRETGDISPLFETVKTVNLISPDTPETSAIVGCDKTFRIAEVVAEALACFERHADDSPYGIAQILYGDWCDPIDMFGTSEVGNSKTRGCGRGVQVRLSAHLFLTLVETSDLLETPQVARALAENGVAVDVARLQAFANRLRRNIVKVAWEDGPGNFPAGFLNCIHELKADGSKPDYARGEIGYTLGSLLGKDFDGIKRRELGGQAFALEMLITKRPWLEEVPNANAMIARLLRTVDRLFYDPKLGLVTFTRPIANNARAIALAGRMGVVPTGTAENGEYHHLQVMMHRFRLSVPGQADTVWRQFKPMMSALRDESLCGPFETPCASYISDKDDPHFGKGMYFGLSGSVDWIVEVFHKIAGLEFALHDNTRPAITVNPNLPAAFDHQMSFRRVVHAATGQGTYRQIPLSLTIARDGKGKVLKETRIFVNGERKDKAEVMDLDEMDRIEIEITRVFEL